MAEVCLGRLCPRRRLLLAEWCSWGPSGLLGKGGNLLLASDEFTSKKDTARGPGKIMEVESGRIWPQPYPEAARGRGRVAGALGPGVPAAR